MQRYFTRLILYVLLFLCPISFYNEPSWRVRLTLRVENLYFYHILRKKFLTIDMWLRIMSIIINLFARKGVVIWEPDIRAERR